MNKNMINVTNRGIEFKGLLYVMCPIVKRDVAHHIRKYNLSAKQIKTMLVDFADSIEC